MHNIPVYVGQIYNMCIYGLNELNCLSSIGSCLSTCFPVAGAVSGGWNLLEEAGHSREDLMSYYSSIPGDLYFPLPRNVSNPSYIIPLP